MAMLTDSSTQSEFQPSQRTVWAQGQPISALMSQALENPHLISLAAGFVDQATLPVEPTQQALNAMFADEAVARSALQYGTTPGHVPLREALLARMQSRGEGANVTADQIVVTAGSNQLLHLVGETLLDPGDIVLCSSPTYLVFLGTLGNLGVRSMSVACDGEGIIPESLEETLCDLETRGELPRVKAIYVVPYFDNPCGLTLPVDRRQAIVELAKRWSVKSKIHVIEDAAYRELRYESEDVASMRSFDTEGDTVIVAETFSKSYSPGIRVGWGVLPKHLVEPLCNQKGNIDFGSPNFGQYLMAQVLNDGLYEPHIETIRQGYGEKLAAMLSAADKFLQPLSGVTYARPTGGLYVWIELPEDINTGPGGKLFDIAIEEGVLYVPGQFCYPSAGAPVRKNTIRLSFGVQTCEKIHEGMECLARAIKRVMAE